MNDKQMDIKKSVKDIKLEFREADNNTRDPI